MTNTSSKTSLTLDIKELADIIKKCPKTVYLDRDRNPGAIPPALAIPGSSRLIWLRADVESWLEKHRCVDAVGRADLRGHHENQ